MNACWYKAAVFICGWDKYRRKLRMLLLRPVAAMNMETLRWDERNIQTISLHLTTRTLIASYPLTIVKITVDAIAAYNTFARVNCM